MFGWVVALGGCVEPEPQDFHPRQAPAPEPQPIELQTGETGIRPTDSGTEIPPPPACDELAPGPYEWYSTGQINTEEDFDFDEDGNLLTEGLNGLVGDSRDGDTRLFLDGRPDEVRVDQGVIGAYLGVAHA